MPIFRYVAIVGSCLLALLFLTGSYLQPPTNEASDFQIDKSTIRIISQIRTPPSPQERLWPGWVVKPQLLLSRADFEMKKLVPASELSHSHCKVLKSPWPWRDMLRGKKGSH